VVIISYYPYLPNHFFCSLIVFHATFIECLKTVDFSIVDHRLYVLQLFCCFCCVFSQKTAVTCRWKLAVRHWLCYWCSWTCIACDTSSTTLPCRPWCARYGYPCHAAWVCRWLGICTKATTTNLCAAVGLNKKLSCLRGTVWHAISVEILSTASQPAFKKVCRCMTSKVGHIHQKWHDLIGHALLPVKSSTVFKILPLLQCAWLSVTLKNPPVSIRQLTLQVMSTFQLPCKHITVNACYIFLNVRLRSFQKLKGASGSIKVVHNSTSQ